MRVISGKFKNKKLNFPKNLKTRPLKDNVKENIFNILEHSNKINVKIKNSNILDLYSGCGSFGIETLSREASSVLFVENDYQALDSLKKNIKYLSLENFSYIHEEDVEIFVKKIKNDKKFNIIFLDPPFSDNKFFLNLISIKNKNILKKDYIIVIHRENIFKDKIDLQNLNIIEERIYGRSKIFFLKFN